MIPLQIELQGLPASDWCTSCPLVVPHVARAAHREHWAMRPGSLHCHWATAVGPLPHAHRTRCPQRPSDTSGNAVALLPAAHSPTPAAYRPPVAPNAIAGRASVCSCHCWHWSLTMTTRHRCRATGAGIVDCNWLEVCH